MAHNLSDSTTKAVLKKPVSSTSMLMGFAKKP